jgi:Asp/Glu/hydantoin racemase
MKDEIIPETSEDSDQVDARPDVSRRDFLASSTGAIAAVSAVAAGTGASLLSPEASAAWPKSSKVSDPSAMDPENFDVDLTARSNTKPGDLYNEDRGYTDEKVTSWKGRRVYGATVGIVQIPANIPMLPGDMGNATTFDFPVLYESIGNVDPFWVLAAEPHPEVLKRTIIASRRLIQQGARSIIGNCGFFANYQPEVSKAIDVPFFNGSLMQVPMALIAVGANKKVGVITANAELLIPSPALKNSGVAEKDMNRVVIVGNEKGKQMNLITSEKGSFSPEALEKELVKLAENMVEDNPDIGAIVLECTEFPPYAHAIQKATQLDVWDFTTMTNFMHAGAMRRPFTGWM